jgi:hypothetical protein
VLLPQSEQSFWYFTHTCPAILRPANLYVNSLKLDETPHFKRGDASKIILFTYFNITYGYIGIDSQRHYNILHQHFKWNAAALHAITNTPSVEHDANDKIYIATGVLKFVPKQKKTNFKT